MLKIAITFVLTAALSAAPALAVPTQTARTAVVVFEPHTMQVTARESGHCWTGSIASQRSDAYRCMVGNAIHDPCFTLSAHAVACPTDMAANRGIAIDLTQPLPRPNQTRNAWEMQLVSGAHCNIGTGTTIPGYPFYCSGGIVCSAPAPGEGNAPVFVRCAAVTGGKVGSPGTYLVRTLYE